MFVSDKKTNTNVCMSSFDQFSEVSEQEVCKFKAN